MQKMFDTNDFVVTVLIDKRVLEAEVLFVVEQTIVVADRVEHLSAMVCVLVEAVKLARDQR